MDSVSERRRNAQAEEEGINITKTLEDDEIDNSNVQLSTSYSTSTVIDNNTNIGLLQEDLTDAMAAHVQSFRAQREFANERAKKSKEDLENNVPWLEKNICLCCDYSQNLDLPHFGGEQPGDTYYYSPRGIFIFGLVDLSNEILSAYVYPEGEGKKGGNNVSSLIYKFLVDAGFFTLAKNEGPGKRLSIIFDNCAGLNKNRMVVRFAQYLVDCQIFREVEMIFLITGHTKNVCDRRFKDLKHNFHHRNVYNFDQLISVMREGKCGEASNAHLKVYPIQSDAFHNWDKFLDGFYKKSLKKGLKISGYHYFRFVKNDVELKNTVLVEESTHFTYRKLRKHATDGEKEAWKNRLQNEFPIMETAPGLAPIKQCELFLKWRSFVPEEYKDSICPEPPAEVLEKVKSEKKEKSRVKREALKSVKGGCEESESI